MKISILVKPNSKRPGVEKLPDGSYRVAVKAPPVDGKANDAVIEALARYFKVPKKNICIVHGAGGRKKWVEVES